jgi:hypothetical protein
VGLTFVGPARSEGLLLAIARAFEEAARARKAVSVVNPALLRGAGGSPATA